MALLLISFPPLFSLPTSLSPPPPPPLTSIPTATTPSIWVQRNALLLLQRGSFHGVRGIPSPIHLAIGQRKGLRIARASSEDVPASQEPGKEEETAVTVGVENLPLESKLKERMEQKLRMKLAKKIRLRRKRLVRKRRMRKKGRWPPSKMKKNKNV